MEQVLLPIAVAAAVWWGSTGLALRAVMLAEARPPLAAAALGACLLGSLAAIGVTASEVGSGAAYGAFAAAIAAWGVVEVSFLAGWITGPRRASCPPGAVGLERLGYAIAAIIHHELALAAIGLAIFALAAGAPNQVAVWTYGVLFAMRISAKLNVFLGVSNLTEGFLPARMAYLKSYFGRKPINLLFPVSVTASTVALVLVTGRVSAAGAHEAVGFTLVAALLALGLLEHWLLVLPIPVERLWGWRPEPVAAGPHAAVLTPHPLAGGPARPARDITPARRRAGCELRPAPPTADQQRTRV